MNLVVTGSRDWPKDDYNPIWCMLDGFYLLAAFGHMSVELSEFHLYAGGATGVDTIAKEWAEISPTHSYNEGPDDPRFEYHEHKANWHLYGKAAGPIRNKAMLEATGSGIVLAFHAHPTAYMDAGVYAKTGTNHCARLAERMGFTVYDIVRNPRST